MGSARRVIRGVAGGGSTGRVRHIPRRPRGAGARAEDRGARSAAPLTDIPPFHSSAGSSFAGWPRAYADASRRIAESTIGLFRRRLARLATDCLDAPLPSPPPHPLSRLFSSSVARSCSSAATATIHSLIRAPPPSPFFFTEPASRGGAGAPCASASFLRFPFYADLSADCFAAATASSN